MGRRTAVSVVALASLVASVRAQVTDTDDMMAPAADYAPILGEWKALPDYPIAVSEAQGTMLKCGGAVVQLVAGGFFNMPLTTYETYKRDISDDMNPWEKCADMPAKANHPMTHMAQAVHEDAIFFAGGYVGEHPGPSGIVAYAYNCTEDVWTVLPDLPFPRAGAGLAYVPEANSLIFAGGGDRITVGGAVGSDVEVHVDYGNTLLLELDNIELGWQDMGIDMPDPRNHQAGVRSCGRYYWVGGQYEEDEAAGNRATVNELFLPKPGELALGPYTNDTDLASWGTVAELPIPLGHISASSMPFKCGILVIAGVTQEKERSSNVLFYNSEADAWVKIGDYPFQLATPICGVVEDDPVSHVWCATGSSSGKQAAFVAELTAGTTADLPPQELTAPAGDGDDDDAGGDDDDDDDDDAAAGDDDDDDDAAGDDDDDDAAGDDDDDDDDDAAGDDDDDDDDAAGDDDDDDDDDDDAAGDDDDDDA